MLKLGRPRKYDDRQRFILSVLWLHGLSAKVIAHLLTRYDIATMSIKSVNRQIEQTPFAGRSNMSIQMRQYYLTQMKAYRFDDGVLPDYFFTVKNEKPRRSPE